MNREWTFTEYDNEEWVHETFVSKEDAIAEGKKKFPNEPIMVGQLKDIGNSYRIENKEIIKLNGGIIKC